MQKIMLLTEMFSWAELRPRIIRVINILQIPPKLFIIETF